MINGVFLKRLIGRTIEIISESFGNGENDIKTEAVSSFTRIIGCRESVDVREFLFIVEFSISRAYNLNGKKGSSDDVRKQILEKIFSRVDENTRDHMKAELGSEQYKQYRQEQIPKMF